MDRGQRDTEKILRELEQRLNKEYAQAEQELQEKLDDYLRRFEIKDKTWQKWVEEGKKTQQEYDEWRKGQLAVGQRWEWQKESIARDMARTNQIAREMTRSVMPEIFADNGNYAMYQAEKDAGVETSFTLYSKESVERLIRDDPDVLPAVGKRTAQRIAEGKDVLWNKQMLQSVMIQGLLQGDSIPELATRLSETVGERNRKAAIRNARTMATGAMNAGRVNAFKKAEDMGIELEQMWIATLDARTRHSHRWLDGEIRPVGEQFSNGLEYPADPHGDASEVYNCRCTLRGVVKGLERRSGKYRDTSKMGGMSYDEWRDAKPVSRDILHQDRTQKAIKGQYIKEYRNGTGLHYSSMDYNKPVKYDDKADYNP